MGFFDKLKGLFAEKGGVVEEVKEDIKVEEIDSFLEGRRLEVENEYKNKVGSLHSEIELGLDKISEDVDVLEGVDVSKKKEQERMKEVVNLGKRDYIYQTRKFVELLRENKVGLGREIEKFVKQSSKSYMKTNLLIGQELENIKNGIVKIKKLDEDFVKDNSDLISKKEELGVFLKKNRDKKNKEKIKLGIEKDISESEEFCGGYGLKLKEIREKIEEIKSGSDYLKREKLVSEKMKVEGKLKDAESRVRDLLDKKVLEKYVHLDLEDKELAESYSKNPVDVFLSDDGLDVVGLVGEIREKISDGSIVIKNSKKVLDKMSVERGDFVGLKAELVGLRSEMENLDSGISGIELGLDDFFKEKIEIENKIVSLKNQIGVLGKKRGRVVSEIDMLNGELVGVGRI